MCTLRWIHQRLCIDLECWGPLHAKWMVIFTDWLDVWVIGGSSTTSSQRNFLQAVWVIHSYKHLHLQRYTWASWFSHVVVSTFFFSHLFLHYSFHTKWSEVMKNFSANIILFFVTLTPLRSTLQGLNLQLNYKRNFVHAKINTVTRVKTLLCEFCSRI